MSSDQSVQSLSVSQRLSSTLGPFDTETSGIPSRSSETGTNDTIRTSPGSTNEATPSVVTGSAHRRAPSARLLLFAVWMTLTLLMTTAAGSQVSFAEVSVDSDAKQVSRTIDVSVCPNIHARNQESPSDLDPRALSELTDAILSNMAAFLANKIEDPHLEQGLLLELYSFVCSQAMYYLVNGVTYGFPAFFVNTCAEIIIVGFLPSGVGVLLGTAIGYTVCSYALNKMLETVVPGLMSDTCNSVMLVARDWFGAEQAEKVFRPQGTIEFFDLDNDPSNCGQVGFEVRGFPAPRLTRHERIPADLHFI